MGLYEIHVFVCENERDETDTRGSCSLKGSREVRSKLKEEVKKLPIRNKVRINKAGCLGTCNQGVSMVIYPQGIWYGKVAVEDLPEIIERTLLKGEIIDRLLMPFMRKQTNIKIKEL